MVEALNVHAPVSGPAGPAPEAAGARALGELAGYQVRAAENPLDLLADAAEELTFAHDNTKELDLKERKSREKRFDGMVEKAARYQELMDKSAYKDALARLADQLRGQRDPRAAQDQALKEFGGDPSLAWAALKKLREDLAGEAPPEVLAALEAAAAELENADGPAIRAGLTGAVAAAEHADWGDPFSLGGDYRRAVCEFYDRPEDMFAFIQEKYGAGNFEAAMDFFFQSLGADLASDQPSHGPAHLEAVGAGLGQARALNSAHALTNRLLERWQTVHQAEDCGLTALDLVKSMLQAKNQRFLGPDDFTPLVQAARPPDIEREVLFLQELLGTVRLFSPQFFDGPESRMKVMAAVQETLDRAIAREDEYLASLAE